MTKKSEAKQQLFSKYGTGYIPHLAFLTPDGKEVKSLQHVGDLPTNELVKKLSDLEGKSLLADTFERSIELGKKLIKPVMKITLNQSEESEDVLYVLKKLPSLKKLASSFVWLEQKPTESKVSTKPVTAGPSVEIIDPYTSKTISIDLNTKLSNIVSQIKKASQTFESMYCANEYYCEGCEQTKKEGGECCGDQMQKIKTYNCKKCGLNSPQKGRCCNQDRESVTE
ncbi:MAG: hypothetical protein HY606_11560 [Planctomycetes bacterium]|nr:hypothetical protein [Planctomycetota bacterium]